MLVVCNYYFFAMLIVGWPVIITSQIWHNDIIFHYSYCLKYLMFLWHPKILWTYFAKSLPIFLFLLQQRVWYKNDKPMHVIAPIKKQAKTSFSCNCISFEGRESKKEASPINATTPENMKKVKYTFISKDIIKCT